MVQPQIIFDLLMAYEQATDLVDKKNIYVAIEAAIDNPPLTFIVFSCLAVERGKEELVLDFAKTMFFNGGRKPLSSETKRAIRLVRDIEAMGISVKVVPILVDTEPRRTWGWSVPQQELTLACQLMIEEAVGSELLPSNWQPMVWSEIEGRYGGVLKNPPEHIPRFHPDQAKYQLFIAQQEKHLRGFSGDYHFPAGIHEAAVRQVAAYATEGVVLENVYPNAILLQSEWPWREKDPLYQWLRLILKKKPLPIIHPFPH
jgi:hypothetical protein